MAAPTENLKNQEKSEKENDPSVEQATKSLKKDTPKATKRSSQTAASSIKDKYQKTKSKPKTNSVDPKQSVKTPAQKRKIVENVNQILGISKPTDELPVIPKLTKKPAAAAGSAQQVPSDPIMHSTPVTKSVMYPYRAPANSQNNNVWDPVPQYLQDITNTPTVQTNVVNQSPSQPVYQMANNQQPIMVSPQIQYPMFPSPQVMGQPRVIDKSSNLMVIPTPYYPNQQIIMDPNNIVTIPLGQNWQNQNPQSQNQVTTTASTIQNWQNPNQQSLNQENSMSQNPSTVDHGPNQPQFQQPVMPQQEYDDHDQQMAQILPLDPDLGEVAEQNIDALLDDDPYAPELNPQQPAPAQDIEQQDDLVVQVADNNQVILDIGGDDDFLQDEIEYQQEEIEAPISNEKLRDAVDSIWDLGLKNPEKMKIKDVYAGIYRPSNVNNVMKTLINQLVRDNAPRQAFKNDGLPRSIHTAVLKGTLALVDTLQSISDVHIQEDPNSTDAQKLADAHQYVAKQRKSLLKKGLITVKCLPYASSKVNSLRRRLQRPFLS